MANRDCNGDFFTADGVRYYRCLWDSTTMPAPANGDKCPYCDRVIDGTKAGEYAVLTVRLAISPSGMELRLPETPNAQDHRRQ
jgi:hypothetical protein